MQEASNCDLVMYLGTTMTLAKGIVHPPAADVQLRPDHLRVFIDKIVTDWAAKIPLPVREDDKTVLDDARHSFVQWPKNQIILHKVISK